MAFFSMAIVDCAKGEDVVIVEGAEGGEQSIRGEVIDWTGEQLRIQQERGSEISISSEQIIEVISPQSDTLRGGNRHRDAAEYEEALAFYLRAFREEQKTWIKRQILAEIITCQAELEQWKNGGESFLILINSDPTTPFFDRIPLSWAPVSGGPSIDSQALQWIASEEPAAQLLGANMLLAGTYRDEARNILRTLTHHEDGRISALALSLWWQTEYVTANETQITSWEARIEEMPSTLRAGAYYVVGRAWAQRREHEKAALSYLHVPFVYPQMHTLSAATLRLAAIEMEKAGQPTEAATLYHEFIQKFSDSLYIDDVRQRLSLLDESE